jgi:pimeloyl-ACP methyl ester carboxylesterase
MNASPSPTVVLVHGGFVDGSGWRGVYDRLRALGHRVAVVQNPTVSLEGDVAATKQVLDDIDGPVVLVGHSYGGVVITETGSDERVAGLVYIAAFAPDKGESVNTLIADPPPGAPVPPILPPATGTCSSTATSSMAPSPATSRRTRPRSWPTPRFPGVSTPSAAPSPNPAGGSRRAGTWSPATTA